MHVPSSEPFTADAALNRFSKLSSTRKNRGLFLFLTWPVRKLELPGTWVVWLRLLRPLAAELLFNFFQSSEELKSLSPQLFFAPEPVTRPAQKAVFQKSASKSSCWPQLLSSSRLPGSRILLPEPMAWERMCGACVNLPLPRRSLCRLFCLFVFRPGLVDLTTSILC